MEVATQMVGQMEVARQREVVKQMEVIRQIEVIQQVEQIMDQGKLVGEKTEKMEPRDQIEIIQADLMAVVLIILVILKIIKGMDRLVLVKKVYLRIKTMISMGTVGGTVCLKEI
jgi:hypothetical protein